VEDLGLLESHFPLMLLVDARRGAPLRAGFVFRGDREMGPIFAFTPEALKPAAAPPPAVAAPAPVKAAPVPVAVPASTTAPVRFRIPKTWFAAAAVVLGIGAGVMYDGVRRESRPVEARRPAPTVEKAATPKPEPPPQESVADRAATDGAAADPEPPAGTPPPPTPEPVVERAAAPPARTIEPPAKAEPLVSRPVGPTAPVVAADRAAPAEHTPEPPASARRRFVPPAPAARTTVPVELVDVPKVDLARPSMAPPVIATAAAAPAPPKVDSRVAVAVDPVPQRGGSFVAPVTVQRAAPRDIHVARPTVINVRVYVDRTGKVDFAELLSDGTGANRDIATAAVFSARKWRFSPAMVNGKAVPAQAVPRFRFEP
jgi:hypothetical protein